MTDIRTIDAWEENGEITPELLHEWAYDDNAVFMSQDEDLLLHDIQLIPKIIQLIADLNCPKREYLFGIISYYTTLNFRINVTPNYLGQKKLLSKIMRQLKMDSQKEQGVRQYIIKPTIGTDKPILTEILTLMPADERPNTKI